MTLEMEIIMENDYGNNNGNEKFTMEILMELMTWKLNERKKHYYETDEWMNGWLIKEDIGNNNDNGNWKW